MSRIARYLTALLVLAALMGVAPALAADLPTPDLSPASDPLAKTASWQPPRAEDVKTQALEWLEKAKAGQAAVAEAKTLWDKLPAQPSGSEVLTCLAETLAKGDSHAEGLVGLCAKPRGLAILPQQSWLTDAKTPPLVANNMRLYFGRWLIQSAMFEEALDQLKGLKPGDVVAPAELLFYQGVAYHRLLQKDLGTKALDQLLEGAESSPRRYVALARLMQIDLVGLKDDTLDHIARRMQDIERRLDLGRAGPKVRVVEGSVIESLDKLIKKIEDEQQQPPDGSDGQSPTQGKGNKKSSSPAPDSRLLQGQGPGEVARKNIGSADGWGNLPPKEREEALEQIGRDFPAHYRDVIEQYFRRLASEESPDNK
jgi:hypothetical protein